MTRTDAVGDVVADELVRVVRADDGVTVSAAKVESAPVAEESADRVRVYDGDAPVSTAKDESAAVMLGSEDPLASVVVKVSSEPVAEAAEASKVVLAPADKVGYGPVIKLPSSPSGSV